MNSDAQASAIAIYRLKRRAGFRKTLGGLDYTRCAEYPIAIEAAELRSAERILEIGASKLFLGCYIADTFDAEVHVCDWDPVVQLQRRWIRAIGRQDLIDSHRFVVRVEDVRCLTYPDESFDRVISVSTLEHVRQIELAMSEVARVLRPGGIASVTVPFSTQRDERWVAGPLYGHGRRGERQFYEYIFDRDLLESTLIAPSGLGLRSLRYLGEPGLKLSRAVYDPIIGWGLVPLRWLMPYVAHHFYHEIDAQSVTATAENIAVLSLEKPATRPSAAVRN